MQTARQFIAGSIKEHEGALSLHPADNGNWFDKNRWNARPRLPQKRNMGKLIGSKFGVTAYAYCDFFGLNDITPAQMAALTFEQAVDIGVELYFNRPGFNKLVQNRVTLSVFDKAWGSGPGRAILMLQELIGIPKAERAPQIGPKTIAAYAAFIKKHGEEQAAILWCNKRIEFDTSLTVNDGPNDPDKIYINGWNNRSRSFLPGTKWWKAAA